MAIDINQLTADELFELARKKQQEEENALRSRLTQLEAKRKEAIEDHAQALARIDESIRELHAKRAQLAIANKNMIDTIDQELAELKRSRGKETFVEAPQPAASPPPESPRQASTPADIGAAVLEAMRGRRDISEGMLKEKLRAKGMDTSELRRVLEKMVRDGQVVSQGAGNYAPGKKR